MKARKVVFQALQEAQLEQQADQAPAEVETPDTPAAPVGTDPLTGLQEDDVMVLPNGGVMTGNAAWGTIVQTKVAKPPVEDIDTMVDKLMSEMSKFKEMVPLLPC
jgi:hypothetical protein